MLIEVYLCSFLTSKMNLIIELKVKFSFLQHVQLLDIPSSAFCVPDSGSIYNSCFLDHFSDIDDLVILTSIFVQVLFQNDSLATLLARVVGILGPIDLELLAKGRDTHKFFTKNHMLYERNQVQMQFVWSPFCFYSLLSLFGAMNCAISNFEGWFVWSYFSIVSGSFFSLP